MLSPLSPPTQELDATMAFPSTPLSSLAGSPYPIHALTYSASPGTYILTGSGDRAIRLYNPFPATEAPKGAVKAGKLVQKFEAHGYEVLDVCVARFVVFFYPPTPLPLLRHHFNSKESSRAAVEPGHS